MQEGGVSPCAFYNAADLINGLCLLEKAMENLQKYLDRFARGNRMVPKSLSEWEINLTLAFQLTGRLHNDAGYWI